ncbi:MAG: helix-turn-helix domain-containing protein, partial [Eubacteriales bacterium]|nr:helix-turn-helix domain-containing protein [Eubacteriales bacterium]
IAMYLCRTMTDDSFEKIGNNFGGRHYSTVMHACDKIQADREKDEQLKHDLDALEKEIEE